MSHSGQCCCSTRTEHARKHTELSGVGVLHSVLCSFAFCAAAQISSFVYPHKYQPFVCTHKWALRLPRSVTRSAFRKCVLRLSLSLNWKTSKTPTMIRCENLCAAPFFWRAFAAPPLLLPLPPPIGSKSQADRKVNENGRKGNTRV